MSIFHLNINMYFVKVMLDFNPFVPNTSFLYPLETSENRKMVEKGCRERVHWEQMS